ncbi:hypothetical protein [Catenuloplanes indicus]|uniref:Uncharacterized protein n=1 Tax=Catenuloplanes indicus TaxID=137267 RepID=A0AAE4B3D0_9ACTN|nr:hypothetical protein [Catenuloplanes indicus]MDQ0371641.1 hypothetical protein [Catenuloplanes indicus]
MANSYYDVAGNIANSKGIQDDTTERRLARAQVFATLALTDAVYALRDEVTRVAIGIEDQSTQTSIIGLQNAIREVANRFT